MIDFGRAKILEVRQQLSDKCDRKVKVLTLASIIIGTASALLSGCATAPTLITSRRLTG
jgi:hypothetical protein